MPRRERGTGTIRRRVDGRYEGRYRDRSGRPRSVYGRSRAEVTEKLENAQLSNGVGAPANVTVGRYLTDIWLPMEKGRVKPRSYDAYEGAVRVNIVPHIGGVPLNALRPSHVERLTNTLIAKGLSPRSAAYARTVLSAALRTAKADGLVSSNAATDARPPRVPQVERTVLSAGQIRELLERLEGDPLRPLYMLAITTGMRDSELRALRWEDVDLIEGLIHVRNQVQYQDGKLVLAPVKTDQSMRTIPIGDAMADALMELHENRKGEFVFTLNGKPLSHTYRQSHWNKIRSELGLNITWHGLRATAATLMIDAGVSPKVVQRTLGHANIQTTFNAYVEATRRGMREAATRMDDMLSGQDKWSKRSD